MSAPASPDRPGTVKPDLRSACRQRVHREGTPMADNINNTGGGGGGNTGLAFIVGAIVVVLAVIAYFVFARGGADTKQVDVNVDVPEISGTSTLTSTCLVSAPPRAKTK